MWVSVGFAGAILVAVAAFWIVFRKVERGRLGRLEKGEDAEVRAGQFIEYALTAPSCAIAHSVTGIARVGDIDHVVATPARLWVIETKYRRVPREHLPEALRRIADNTTAVWEWAPPGTPVRGCLVLAYESRVHRKTYDYGKEPIVVHTPASLAREAEGRIRTRACARRAGGRRGVEARTRCRITVPPSRGAPEGGWKGRCGRRSVTCAR